MSSDIELPRRRDQEGDFHRIRPEACPDCACTQFVAEEDPDLVWEPGKAWDATCTNRDCHCHSDPVIGVHRT
jgi:hypothetical protein